MHKCRYRLHFTAAYVCWCLGRGSHVSNLYHFSYLSFIQVRHYSFYNATSTSLHNETRNGGEHSTSAGHARQHLDRTLSVREVAGRDLRCEYGAAGFHENLHQTLRHASRSAGKTQVVRILQNPLFL